ncbi:rod shape-determining protein MreD [Salicola sp. Rm-C-2C1-2]|uniref:rod shape-determining protein MreD n=1 Tax=Salicola sp. Rm-C-2C1-2 TaxID=3141321 RepID=UPI0032E45D24
MVLRSISHPVAIVSVVVALVATIALFPQQLAHWRPEWVGLVVIYWVLRAPKTFGIVMAWVVGLLVDVLRADILGMNALAMALIAFMVLASHQRLQLFPVAQQALVVFLMIGLAHMVVHFLHQVLGETGGGFDYLLPAVTSGLIWPVFRVFWDFVNRKLE